MEQMLAAIQKLMLNQELSSEEDIRKALGDMMAADAGELNKHTGPLTPKEQAEQLVHSASGMGQVYGRELLEDALDLDPDCIFAYEMLGEFEESSVIANVFFEKGITLGRQQFGGDFLKEHKGIFWMVHETRPFMRCLASSADCLVALNRKEEALAIYREMLELNPNDNQGVREPLGLYLVEAGDFHGFRELVSKYPEDMSVYMVYNEVLAAFKEHGPAENALALLAAAKERNPHVIRKLKAKREPKEQPSMYAIGSPEEAIQYVMLAWQPWQDAPGAVDFLSQTPRATKKKKP
jgi:tetratricopeptide (TPR) repeat protein